MKIRMLLAVLLAGCATTGGGIEGAKSSWEGARYEDVVARWGAPNRQTGLSDGRQVYTWESAGSGGGFPASVGVFGGSGGAGVGAIFGLPGMGMGGESRRCDRTLTFKDDRLVDQFWQGHPGYCSAFKRQ